MYMLKKKIMLLHENRKFNYGINSNEILRKHIFCELPCTSNQYPTIQLSNCTQLTMP